MDLSDGIQAARYDDLKIGDKTASVFAIPTTEGVATLACAADAEVCATIASSLRITEGKAFPVGPSEDYAKGVERALGTLEKHEKSAARELKNAGQRATQVAATSAARRPRTPAPPSRSTSSRSARPTRSSTRSSSRRCAPPAAPTRRPRARVARKDRNGYKREGSKALGFAR